MQDRRRGSQTKFPRALGSCSVIVVPRVITPALNADMLVAALITKSTSQRAVVEGTTASACVRERHDLLPLFLGDALIPLHFLCELDGRLGRLVFLFVLVAKLLEQGFVAVATSLVLARARLVLGRCWSRWRRTGTLPLRRCRDLVLGLTELLELGCRASVVPELLVVREHLFERQREGRKVFSFVIVQLVNFLRMRESAAKSTARPRLS